jgi:hypothetical protein
MNKCKRSSNTPRRRSPLSFDLLETRVVPSGNLPGNALGSSLQLANFGANNLNEVVFRGSDGAWHIGPTVAQEAEFGTLQAYNGNNVVVGDFNGDGTSDIAGLAANGIWQVGLNAGGAFPPTAWGQWLNAKSWTTLLAGDLTGSGRDDVLAMNLDGTLELAESTGSSFVSFNLGQWAPRSHWDYLGLADVDGNGTKALVGFNNDGTWWVGRLDTATMTMSSQVWAQWSPASRWKQVFVGDFNADGRADVAGFNKDGSWYVGISTQYPIQDPFNDSGGTISEFATTKWAQWSAASNWQQVFVSDFNHDGRSDIAGFAADGSWWLGTSTGGSFGTAFWGAWDPTVTFDQIAVGAWDGQGPGEVLGFSSTGSWWLGTPGPVPAAAA